MTKNTCAERGFYPENRSARLWKAIAFAGGLVLGLYSGPIHAAPRSGGDAVQGLYDALLSTMRNGKALGQSERFPQLEPVIPPQLRHCCDGATVGRFDLGKPHGGTAPAVNRGLAVTAV